MKMGYKVVFSKAALLDMKDARRWYNLQQKGLGKRFVADVKETVEVIKRNPYHASEKYSFMRMASCKTFPYAIHFNIEEETLTILVTAIFHFHRKPIWLMG